MSHKRKLQTINIFWLSGVNFHTLCHRVHCFLGSTFWRLAQRQRSVLAAAEADQGPTKGPWIHLPGMMCIKYKPHEMTSRRCKCHYKTTPRKQKVLKNRPKNGDFCHFLGGRTFWNWLPTIAYSVSPVIHSPLTSAMKPVMVGFITLVEVTLVWMCLITWWMWIVLKTWIVCWK